METFPLGKVSVPTPGTAVPLSSLLPANFPSDHKCWKIIVSQIASTGNVVFGTTAVKAATLVGAIKEFIPPGTTGLRDTFVLEDGAGAGNQLHVDDYALDVGTANDGAIVTIVVR